MKQGDSTPGADGSLSLVDGYIRLAAGILLQAMVDIQRGDYADRVDAITWLATDEAEAIGELVGIEQPFKAYITGRAKLPYSARCGRKEAFGWRIG